MARTRVARLAFNRGLVSRLGMARSDLKRLALAAETQTNWMTRTMGSMMLRPGLGHIGSSLDDALAYHLPFVFSIADKALVELTAVTMRVWVDDDLVEREARSTTITNGTFETDLTGWTDADESGATSAYVGGGRMGLTGNGTAYAIRRQEVTVAAADIGEEHGLHIAIDRGPVLLRIGAISGDDDIVNETSLGAGVHSLAFTPPGASFWLEFKSQLERQVQVLSVAIEGAGAMEIETPWVEADLRLVRYDQSGDVLFIACGKTTDKIGYPQRRIERRATRSWSVVLYESNDGPFRTLNTSDTTLTVSALTGNITVDASTPVFRDGHVGAIFEHVSVGQRVEETITAENTWSDPIRVSGVDSTRIFTIILSGLSGTASTVTLQRSLDEPGNWEDVSTGGSPASPWTADTTRTYDDGLDNQIVYYRIGVDTGDYAAGTILATLAIGTGSITGVFRVTGYTSQISVEAEVLTAIGSLEATTDWSEGQWSGVRGYPTSVTFHEGRLAWAGRDSVQLSVSDAYDSNDPEFEGDAGPINRTIGSGPVDTINWLLSLQRLLLGGQGAEFSVRSSSLDEPLTPTNFHLKPASTQGSAAVAAVKVDQSGIYVQRGGTRVYELAFGQSGIDYESTELSAMIPEIGRPGIVSIDVQRQPDTRVHFVRSDGTAAVLVFDKTEQVTCWLEIETDGSIEDVVVLPGDPGDEEDHVYYSVKRTVNSTTKRYLEKWAFETECFGDEDVCKLADSHVVFTNAPPSATVTGLTHLVGETVVAWADGVALADADGDIATFTVNGSGEITLTHEGAALIATTGCVGLAYQAPWKPARLVEPMEIPGAGLVAHQNVQSIGFILANTHAKGVKFGRNLTESTMNDLPQVIDGAVVDSDTVHEALSIAPIAFPGGWSTDARPCLLAQAPRPATVMAAIMELEVH